LVASGLRQVNATKSPTTQTKYTLYCDGKCNNECPIHENKKDGGFAEILAEGVTEEQRQETLKNLKEYRATQSKKGGKE